MQEGEEPPQEEEECTISECEGDDSNWQPEEEEWRFCGEKEQKRQGGEKR